MGVEVELRGKLPLGIVSGTAYATVELRLLPDERTTFLSDGVVEAENPRGELFGFDRARGMSGKAAVEIADAAQAFRQNDDITVVTVRRTV